MLTRIDHVGIACRDLDATIAFYQSTFGLTVVSEEVNVEQGVREAMLAVTPADHAHRELEGTTAPVGEWARAAVLAGPSYVQLLEPLGPDTPVGRFLARRGQGIHHIGYGVHDIDAALVTIAATGVRLIDARPRHGSLGASIAFLHPGDVGGVLTELVEPAAR